MIMWMKVRARYLWILRSFTIDRLGTRRRRVSSSNQSTRPIKKNRIRILVRVRRIRMNCRRVWERRLTAAIKHQLWQCLVLRRLSSHLLWTRAPCHQSSFRAAQHGPNDTNMNSWNKLKRIACLMTLLVQELWINNTHSSKNLRCLLSSSTSSQEEETLISLVKTSRRWAEKTGFQSAYWILNLIAKTLKRSECTRVKIPQWSSINLDRGSTYLRMQWSDYISKSWIKYKSIREDRIVDSKCR